MSVKEGISNGVKILVVYATAGAGHKKAARAIYQEAKRRGLDVAIADILDYTWPLFKYFYSYGYIFLIKYLPCIWRFAFHRTDSLKGGFFKKVLTFFARPDAKKFSAFLEKERFNLVISTHFAASQVVAGVKQSLNIRLISVITDFYPHTFWYNRLIDKYCVASTNARARLMAFGISSQDIEITGIPTEANFSQGGKRYELSEKIGVEPGLFTVLIMTGAIGIGPIERIVDLLKNEAQLLVVCGTNKKLFKRLKNKLYAHLKVFGLIDNVCQLMSVSDVIITKPGGLTISEAISRTLPMIFFSIIPGQEVDNARIIEEQGAGIILKDISRIREIIIDLKENREKLERYRENIRKIYRPNAAAGVLEAALLTLP